MRAAILHAPRQPLVIEDVELSDTLPNEVRVRVVASGLCHSDYARMVGDRACPFPALLGHEVSGVIEQVGKAVWHVRPGDAVIVGAPHCGACRECQAGRLHRCDAPPTRQGPPRITLGGHPVFQFVDIGGFAETVLVDGRAVVKVPDGVPVDLAALFGCAVISGVGAVTHCARVQPGALVAVIGCGGVGLNAIQGARIAGAERIVAVDVNPVKLEMAKLFGATDVVLGGPGSAEQVLELTKGGVDYAFEVVGRPETIVQALAMLRRGGAAVLVGIPKAGAEVSLQTDVIFRKELRVLSTRSGSVSLQSAVEWLARWYLAGDLALEPLVARRIGLNDIGQAIDQLARGEVARTLITFDTRGGVGPETARPSA